MNYGAWKDFLNENKINNEDILLLEARVKDVKKKYPKWQEAGWIDWSRERLQDAMGPKGVSKYLLFWVREMDRQFQDEEVIVRSDESIKEIAEVMLDLVFKFQENEQRIEEKDIYKYNAGTLQALLNDLGVSSRSQRKQEKETAVEGSEIVYDDNDIFGVRPYDENASCYYGKNTRWCISATESRNYFDQYTEDGNAFVMLRLNNLPERSYNRRIALVFDKHGDWEDAFNANDDSVGWETVVNAVHMNLTAGMRVGPPRSEEDGHGWEIFAGHTNTIAQWAADGGAKDFESAKEMAEDLENEARSIADEIARYSSSNVVDNPPIPDYSGAADQAIEEADLQHAHASWDEDGEYFYFSGGMDLEIEDSEFDDAEYDLPTDWRSLGEISSAITDAISDKFNIYIEEADISSYGASVTISLRSQTGDYEPNPTGLEQFIEYEVRPLDQNHQDIMSLVKLLLMDKGYMPHSGYSNLLKNVEKMEESLKHFKVTSADHEYIGLVSEDIEWTFPDDPSAATITGEMIIAGQPRIKDMLIDNLRELEMKLRNYLDKQLDLPFTDLPPRVQKELSIPNVFDVRVAKTETQTVLLRAEMNLVHRDSDLVFQEAIGIVEFLESNFSQLQEAAQLAMDQFVREEMETVQQQFGLSAPASSPGANTEEDVFQESVGAQVENYLNSLVSERSRQYEIYEFYLMLGYTPQKDEDDKIRGLEHIVADIRAIPSVTVVSIKVKNQRLSETDYIAGLKIKFIPSLPGVLRSPEDAKLKILQMIKATKGVRRIFKVSARFEKSTL